MGMAASSRINLGSLGRGSGVWKGPWGGSHGQTGETTATSEHLLHFCAHQCGESSQNPWDPRADLILTENEAWAHLPKVGAHRPLKLGRQCFMVATSQSSVSGYVDLGAVLSPLALWPWVSYITSLSLSSCKAGTNLTNKSLDSWHIVAKSKPSVRVNYHCFPRSLQYHHLEG